MSEPKNEVKDGHKIHFSVGALIENAGKFLLIDRALPPFGFAGPAGHVDEGEEPIFALKREVKEETGLEILEATLAAEEFVPWNKCSHGTTGHHWYLYRCTARGEIKADKHEVKSIGWYNLADVKNFEPVWEHWFKKLGML